MAETTARLNLPMIAAAQAQKHVTHNEGLAVLDALVQLSVRGRRAAPPTPAENERFIVDDAPSGAFAGRAGAVARVLDGLWRFATPQEGWRAWVEEEDRVCVFRGDAWVPLVVRETDRLGIGAPDDDTNKLTVASDAVLFNHAGGDARVKVNKAASGGTASLVFQTGFSGRVELGTAGDDKFRCKVSNDGATWRNALTIDPATGYVGVGNESPATRLDIVGDNTASAQIKVRTESTSPGLGGGVMLHHNNAGAGMPLADDRLGYVLFGSTLPGGSIQGAGLVARAEADYAPTSAPSYFAFETAPVGLTARSERMRITAAGRVGIGTTTPACPLDVAGAIRVGQFAKAALPSAASSGAGAIVYVGDEAGGATLAFSDGSAWRRVTDRVVVS